ncbi:sensor domain-containing diguanylate cyclase [Marinobacter sp. S0848L]|uniref:sensor domain-containing diguanylate cyclase n=1 Tax=Marinobacter sp. S0848L TaxID=2926423 RepID=UPI001FF3878D|nr:sensor domain-containing diguanylate cyclase [Marinobacter sp. S0848L]MCK0106671.1 sensor domain-containing diguanylate cyclase [Marinobacter sp. S0848L]
MRQGPPEDSSTEPLQANRSPLRRALWAAFVYLLVGLAWIQFSDQLAEVWFPDARTLSKVQTWKGFLFVGVTGFTLFFVMFRQLHKDRLLLLLQIRQRKVMREHERQLTVLLNNLPGMAFRFRNDHAGSFLFISDGCEELTGYSAGELMAKGSLSESGLMDDNRRRAIATEAENSIRQNGFFSIEFPITCKGGRDIWVWARGTGLTGDDGTRLFEGIVLDVSKRKALEQELEELATKDSLTGLLNRRELSRVLAEELERAHRYHRSLAVLWIDFDHFKKVNDSYGHAAGDLVLSTATQILDSSVRGVDSVGRFGGEEFVVVLPEMGQTEAMDTAERLRLAVREKPVSLTTGDCVSVTASIGVAVYPVHGTTVEELSAEADKAMYRAKMQGRDCVAIAQPAQPVHNEVT